MVFPPSPRVRARVRVRVSVRTRVRVRVQVRAGAYRSVTDSMYAHSKMSYGEWPMVQYSLFLTVTLTLRLVLGRRVDTARMSLTCIHAPYPPPHVCPGPRPQGGHEGGGLGLGVVS